MEPAFVADSKTAIHIKLIRSVKEIEDDGGVFHPKMTHQMMTSEMLQGYKGLRINVYYSAATLSTYLGYEYSEKDDDVAKADNINKIFGPFLDNSCCNLDLFHKVIDEDENFTPFGECISHLNITSENQERNFEVYTFNIFEKGYETFLRRFHAFLIWFIDAANCPTADDPNWQIFLLYEKYTSCNQKICYAIAGYISVYEYYGYPQHKRPRISQVLILPPFQSMGLCAKLLMITYKYYWAGKNIIDIPVEEPGEQFQRVRDFVDSSLCLRLACFSNDLILRGYNKGMYYTANNQFKLTEKQVMRVFFILWYRILNLNDCQECGRFKRTLRSSLHKQLQKRNMRVASLNPYIDNIKDSQISEDDAAETLSKSVKDCLLHYSKVVQRLNTKTNHD